MTVDVAARIQAPDAAAARERAFFFANPDGQRLYAVLHPAAGPSIRELGILFCHPLSEEKHSSQRALVDFARLLSRHGYPALRFDGAGFGDSEGEMAAVTIRSLLRDVRAAISRLIDESGVSRVVLIGVRFGALIARLAADSDERVAGLVLVAPVVSGGDYWNGLLRSQQMSCMTRGAKAPRLEDLRRELAENGQLEIKAEFFGRSFGEELTAVDLLAAPARFRGAQLIAGAVDEAPNADISGALITAARQAGSEVTAMAERVGVFWTGKALYDGFRPRNLYQSTLDWLAGLPP